MNTGEKYLQQMIRVIIILAAIFIFSCENKSPQSKRIILEDNIEIVFKNRIVANDVSCNGIFEITNNGNATIYVGVIFDTKPARCGFPVYERLIVEEWVKIPVVYEGGVIFSPLEPNQKVLFEASLDRVESFNEDDLRLLIASTQGCYFRSKPFSLAHAPDQPAGP